MRPCIEREIRERKIIQLLDDNGMHLVSFDPLDDNYIDSDALYNTLQYKLEEIDKEIQKHLANE